MTAITSFLVAILILFVFFAYNAGEKISTYGTTSFKGPRGFPMIGNTLDLLANFNDFNEWLVDLTKIYGQTFKLSLIARPKIIVTSDPVIVEHVLKNNFNNYGKGPRFHKIFEDLLGDGIFNVDGKIWHIQRKTSSHLFSANMFRNHMFKVFNEHSNTLLDILKAKARSEDVIDFQDMMYRYTLDGITEIAFGQSLHTLRSIDEEVKFVSAFDNASRNIVKNRAPYPIWMWLFWKWLPSTSEKKLTKNIDSINSFAYTIVKRRKQEMVNNSKIPTADGKEGKDFLSLMIASYNTQLKKGKIKNIFSSHNNEVLDEKCEGNHAQEKYLRDVILNFMIAGRDTTAQAINWMFYCLYQNPDAENKVYEEIQAVLGENGITSYDNVKDLVYTQATFYETLRLYPSVAKNIKYAFGDDVLPGGYCVSKGDTILYSSYVMGRSEELWEYPMQFSPERFIKDGKLSLPSLFTYTAFQAGPRTCLGKDMALYEAVIILANVLRNVKIVPAEENGYTAIRKSINTPTLPMKNGHPVKVVFRNKYG